MKSAARLGMAMWTAVLIASDLDPKLLRLIGPDTKAIYGIDVARYRHSMLAELFPMSTGFTADEGKIHLLMVAIHGELDHPLQLRVLRGALSPVLGENVALLDSTTGVTGDEDRVREAIGRWRQEMGATEEIASRVRQLSASFDTWFLVVRPLEK